MLATFVRIYVPCYNEVPLIWPLKVITKSGLNSEQASLSKPIYIGKIHFGTETSGLKSESGLNLEWS